jgi:hypothetical protein
MLDISYCRQKLFMSLQANLVKMFPNDLLITSVQNNGGLSSELWMEITLTTKDR